jgi:Pyruvate/2-oxoacid:ferredoxin oxidoreductase gamma subunit
LNEDRKDLITVISVVVIIFAIFILSACNGGWSVANIDISSSDSLYADFMIIIDQDSIQHWYARTTAYGGILVGDNWCHKHNQWENVEKK